MDAVIMSQVGSDDAHPALKKQLAIQSLQLSAQEVERNPFGGYANPKFAYTNSGGTSLLRELRHLTQQVRSLSEETAVQAKESAELKKQLQAVLDNQESMKWTAGTVYNVAVAIRCRFFENYRKSAGQGSFSWESIDLGNKVAHEGDLLADATLITMGHITDSAAFRELYGVDADRAQQYLGWKPVLAMINKRATILAGGGISRRGVKWDTGLQECFEKVLQFAEGASSRERESFDLDSAGTTPEKHAWLRISRS